ncbi:MAG: hypothetical protein P8Z78_12250 [Gammaproteobacteria bacterium]
MKDLECGQGRAVQAASDTSQMSCPAFLLATLAGELDFREKTSNAESVELDNSLDKPLHCSISNVYKSQEDKVAPI